MPYASIDDLRSQLGARLQTPSTAAYAEKMLHQIPEAAVVDREQFILEHCTGKRVLEFGASGPLHNAILKVAARVYGVDRVPGDHVIAFDLDDVTMQCLPPTTDGHDPYTFDHVPYPETIEFDVVVCGEILEHLANPGWFLTRLHKQFSSVPTIITVPNAFSDVARKHLANGTENVNRDHVCWYSFRTLKTLLGRAGYSDFSFAWYKGEPLTAEGLVVLCNATTP